MPINNSTSTAIFRWRPACWLRVSGEDAAPFLQGQFTNDLRPLSAGAPASYGLWLTVKGKVLADSFVLRDPTTKAFWIGSYYSSATVVRERLESHVIADDVVIEDVTTEWAGVSLFGDDARADVNAATNSPSAFIFPGRRDRSGTTEWVYSVTAGWPVGLANRMATSSARELEAGEVERRRIEAGIPAIPADIGPGDLPNEAGLEADAISYTKGCYLGQEVMARLKSMGQVRRRLLRVKGAGERWPALPAPVFAGARQVGELRSAASDGAGGWVGLALLTLMHVKADTELAFAADAAPVFRLSEAP